MKHAASRPGRLMTYVLVPIVFAGIVLVAALGLGSGYISAIGVAKLGSAVEKATSRPEAKDPAHGDRSTKEGKGESFPVAQEVPLFDDWPKESPAFVLLLSGEMFGYMRPCGCSEGQSGGLSRRAGLIEYLKNEKKWETLPVDFGDLIKAEVPWDEARYRYVLESLKTMGYKVVGVGTKDLSIKAMTVAGEALNADPLTLLAGNIKSDQDDFNVVVGEFILPSKTIEIAGKKVAIGSVIGDAEQKDIRDQSIKVQPVAEATTKILEKMKEDGADLKVLLAHMTKEEAVELAKSHPGFDLIVTQSLLEHPTKEDSTQVGDTLVTWIGQKGMEVGVVGYWPEGTPKIRYEIVPIDPRFKENEQIKDIYGRFVKYLGDEEYLAKMPQLPPANDATYIGSGRCASCHPRAFDIWKKSKHSHALVTLQDAKPEGQDYNPECVKCHVVGQGFTSGFITPDKTPDLGGVGCENCHGPGSRHAGNPADEAGRALMRVSKNANDCQKCHDAENSVHFNFETYWPKVAHPGKP